MATDTLAEARRARLRWIEGIASRGDYGDAAGRPASRATAASVARSSAHCDVSPATSGAVAYLSELIDVGSRPAGITDEEADAAMAVAALPLPVALAPFAAFVERLKSPDAAALSARLQSALAKLADAAPTPDAARGLIERTGDEMRAHPLWADTDAHADDDDATAALARFAHLYLYDALHPGLGDGDDLHARIASLSFLTAAHLGATPALDAAAADGSASAAAAPLAAAEAALLAVAARRAPADKLRCLAEASGHVSALLRDDSDDSDHLGADEYLPALIFAVKRANPLGFCADLAYVAAHTDPDRLVSADGYVLTNFNCAVEFLRAASATDLNISARAFDAQVAQCREIARAAAVRRDEARAAAQVPAPAEEDEPPFREWTAREVRREAGRGTEVGASRRGAAERGGGGPGVGVTAAEVLQHSGWVGRAESLRLADVGKLAADYEALVVLAHKLLDERDVLACGEYGRLIL